MIQASTEIKPTNHEQTCGKCGKELKKGECRTTVTYYVHYERKKHFCSQDCAIEYFTELIKGAVRR